MLPRTKRCRGVAISLDVARPPFGDLVVQRAGECVMITTIAFGLLDVFVQVRAYTLEITEPQLVIDAADGTHWVSA